MFSMLRHCRSKGAEVLLVMLQPLPVLHEDGERCFADKTETKALEHLAVLRFREHLHRVMATLGSLADEMGNKPVGKMGIAQPFAYRDAFDDVALQTSASQNLIAVGLSDDGIIIHLIESKLVGLEEPLHLPTPKRHRHGNAMDFIIHHAHIRLRFSRYGLAVLHGCECGCACRSEPLADREDSVAARHRWRYEIRVCLLCR